MIINQLDIDSLEYINNDFLVLSIIEKMTKRGIIRLLYRILSFPISNTAEKWYSRHSYITMTVVVRQITVQYLDGRRRS